MGMGWGWERQEWGHILFPVQLSTLNDIYKLEQEIMIRESYDGLQVKSTFWFIVNCNIVADDDFDERSRNSSSARTPQSQLDDIRDWDSGNKSIAEEAIDKVKEFVSKVKFFDTPDDYPWVCRLIFESTFMFATSHLWHYLYRCS